MNHLKNLDCEDCDLQLFKIYVGNHSYLTNLSYMETRNGVARGRGELGTSRKHIMKRNKKSNERTGHWGGGKEKIIR